ncbi:MAG: zinc-binding dehydrogenase [Deltaproteobacteria bacterium]|nr:zinc-binding dehydrogenase [Deltaproteobacteria bacterium]
MKCAIFYGPMDVRIEKVEIPIPTDDEILVKVKAALTCGSDLKTYRRGHPTMIKPPSPFGHEFSGEVVKIGRNIKCRIKVGDRIVCANTAPCGYCFYCRLGRESMCEDLIYLNGAYSQYITVQKRIVEKNTFIIPKDISFEEAALTEPLACVVHGIEESGIMMGDRVAINGAGPIGLMFVKLAGLKGAYVIVSDLSKDRLESAKKMGARETIQIQKGIDQVEEVKCRTEGERGVDVAIDATGIPDIWEKTVKMVRKGGTANLFGGCSSGTTISIDTALIHYHEITIKGIYHHTPLYVKKAFELITNRILDARQFITDTVPLDELIPTLEKVGRQEGIKYKIDVG